MINEERVTCLIDCKYHATLCVDKPSQLSSITYQLLVLDCPTLKAN